MIMKYIFETIKSRLWWMSPSHSQVRTEQVNVEWDEDHAHDMVLNQMVNDLEMEEASLEDYHALDVINELVPTSNDVDIRRYINEEESYISSLDLD